ncbi:NrdH-redoxin [Candidatus Uhrbacteria bacterium CG_4_9_14_0_2_um_filter_41_50]|uniref:NrdH-redoxin n=1 Tax=Candidatus Uhrbacteria bacterium CG_4_9_14_0_2_um_filter_41_50 TaxID=1975031 RepID=A0A2M8EP54_9BACT|nr:MAG: NrdH-redoxin [Candidatus Uhrbacteria bacterium CG_4_10_14_3_um_filter_41_21]PIZ55067.1 MAG: NrdH-redoxin [Candidatus Uhrbacteria bacterium CG_4_10_14_0_2_um_filter_41_21]PJB85015.1 MAG: NrdH-redoxin [Candidatus Uhrbacteria bacterium CG_4_9_14_0_8_um_filter_41_16]PJC24522.1 MAG: NrdH-redoxin [Candidatus Uhrbacteria bacterium CG_4_9_14_0_2_um_filter_41_50]PJE74748.1 MAG: NrdH-redoxin [Candidatus Uhrbacteria bacterium CG10_big_fil_rev_8_21_14_0_10_41_26]
MKVTVYSTPTCPFCKQAKKFLDNYNVEFEDIDVSVDTEKAQLMIEKSNQMGVPVIDIDGEILVGFDEKKLKELLSL